MKKLAFLSLCFLALASCNNKPTEQKEEKTTQNAAENAYQWDKHQDFNIFFADFKTAVKAKDKAAVYKMMNLPFVCNDVRCNITEPYEGSEKYQNLSIANESEFNSKYDLIFTEPSVEIILSQQPKNRKDFPAEDEHMPLDEMYRPNEYCLDINDAYVLSFMPNDKGMYKLNEIPYRP